MVKNKGWAIFGDAMAQLYQKLMINTGAPSTNYVTRELILQIAGMTSLLFTMQ